MIGIIVAYDKNRAIGKKGGLLWNMGEMKADMKRFRDLTMGKTVVMGSRTLDSIGNALPGRRNIVLTRDEPIAISGVEVVHSFDEAYELVGSDEIFIIGGGEIYRQSIGKADRIYATEVDAVIDGADTFFPEIDDSWQLVKTELHELDESNKYSYSFVEYERK